MSEPTIEPTILTLRFPVELKTSSGSVIEKLAELQLHPLRGSDARKVLNAREKGTGDFVAALVCASARIPAGTFDQLDARDITAAAEVAGPFLGDAQPTSTT